MEKDIAIIGMSCRFPQAKDYHEFWNNLMDGKFSVTEIPEDRWDWRSFYGTDAKVKNKTNSKWGGFIKDLDKFDPLFFNISPKEANYIDPQHRLFLEAAWHAIEDAAYRTESLSGKKIGVYVGVSKNDYAEMLQATGQEISSFISTGTVHSILANRVSYLLNLTGKSEVVDTACSSSLVALHNAIRDIRLGTCEGALVGGVNALITPTMYLSHGKSGMLSSEGKCKTFDENSDGYVRAEGVGCLFIKPLAKAEEDQDNIIGIIKGTAINHNGRTNSLTSPSPKAQSEVVQAAMKDAGVMPQQIGYVEAHGTATPLGDPIEVSGLKKAFGKTTEDKKHYCGLGSVKTNIGHLESAAGIAGLIKVVLCMRHKKIPGILHFNKLNPYIDLDNSPFYIVDQSKDWQAPQLENGRFAPRMAGVSSFGMGGVNGHIILQEYTDKRLALPNTQELLNIPFSAKNKKQLNQYIQHFLDFIKNNSSHLSLSNIAYTMQAGRDEMKHRCIFQANNLNDLRTKCELFLAEGNLDYTNLDTKLKAWIDGETINWNENQKEPTGQRIALPGYPFARRECWVDRTKKWIGSEGVANIEKRDSLVSFQTKEVAKGLAYACAFQPTDYFIRDHIVQGECLLPGVAYLELARSIFQLKTTKNIHQIDEMYWMHPVKVGAEKLDAWINLVNEKDDFSFGVYSEEGLHAKGKIVTTKHELPSQKIDLQKIKSRCTNRKNKTEIYSSLSASGLAYQKTFQTIQEGFFGKQEALCRLEQIVDTNLFSKEIWEPSMLDGVFQTVVGLCLWGDLAIEDQLLPFFLKSIKVYQPLTPQCYAYVHKSVSEENPNNFSFNMYLCDEQGTVLMAFNEFVKRAYKKAEKKVETIKENSLEMLSYTTAWKDRCLGIHRENPKSLLVFDHDATLFDEVKQALNQTHCILILPGDHYEKINDQKYRLNPKEVDTFQSLFQDLAADNILVDAIAYKWTSNLSDLLVADNTAMHALLYLTQSLIKSKEKTAVRLFYLYDYQDNINSALHRMAGGFARTLFYENPKIAIQTVGKTVSANITFSKMLLLELSRYALPPLREILYTEQLRKEKEVIPLSNVVDRSAPPLLKQKGCYLITGGTGGLGMTFSAYLAEKYQATLVLLGRKAKNTEIEDKLKKLESLGGTASYYQADVTDQAALNTILSDLKNQGKSLHGVIHSAGLIDDGFIINKDSATFDKVLAPKVQGTINLDACTKEMQLDFFLVFSSIASLMPNQGQCDYASANSFLDHFMEIRNHQRANGERQGISVAINWPLWANGGITVGEKEEKHLWEVFGMKPMKNEDALAGFENLLQTPIAAVPNQIILIEGIKHKIDHHLNVETEPARLKTVASDAPLSLTDQLVDLITTIPNTTKKVSATDIFYELGLDSMGLVKFAQGIQSEFGIAVNPTVFFEHNTAKKLANYLEEECSETEKIQLSEQNYFPKTSLIDAEWSEPNNLRFYKRFSNEEFFMQDHVVEGMYNVPGACYIEMARQAASLLGIKVSSLSNNYWPEQLSSPGPAINVTVELEQKESAYAYEIISKDKEGNKVIHAVGNVSTEPAIQDATIGHLKVQEIKDRITLVLIPKEVYARIIAEGLHVGPSFMPMQRIHVNEKEALGQLKLPQHVSETLDDYILHPSMLTGVFQTALLNNKPEGIDETRYIPVAIDEVTFSGRIPRECYVYTVAHESNESMSRIKKFDAIVADLEGNIVLKMFGFTIREISGIGDQKVKKGTAKKNQPVAVSTEVELEKVENLLKELLSDGIGLEVEELDSEESFQAFGINSRMIIDLNHRLEQVFGNLSKTLFFEFSNIQDLATYFQKNHTKILLEKLGGSAVEESIDVPLEVTVEVEEDTIFMEEEILPTEELKPALPIVQQTQDIAIVGIGCKYPKANSLSEFWNVLKNGEDCITEITKDRFDYTQHFEDKKGGDLLYAKWGGFIDDVDKFDPLFFNISPREAERIDPQERLFLEVVWATLEDAGITKEALTAASKKVGVFVGALWQPYVNLGVEETLSGNPIAPSGLLYSIANRISYFLNLNGPSLAIDTACSSSLTALHYACESIKNGESKSCIVGGVNLSLSLSKYLFLSQNSFLSTDGRCRSFGAGGDGYVPGEGIGAVLLKPLEEAIANGDRIYGVVKGSAVNHGGRTNGYTVPNPNLQSELISSVLEKTNIDPRTISYVEAHGTGTSLGDPIEMTGLTKTFSQFTDDKQFCAIGSVKANIGHLEATAGIAGLTKILLQMQHKSLAPSIHSATLNPNIDFEATPFYVQQELSEWKAPLVTIEDKTTQAPLRAMLSSFGAGGSNAHIIVEAYQAEQETPYLSSHPAIVPISAKNKERLKAQVSNLQIYLDQSQVINLYDLAYTLQTGREAMEERLVLVVKDKAELQTQLTRFLEGYTKGLLIGNVQESKTNILLKGKAGAAYLEVAIKEQEFTALAQLWATGVQIDWNLLYKNKTPKKISLPTYPFARERYWLPENEHKPTSTINGDIAKIHPLLHSNESDFEEQKYTSIFSGKESFFEDHQVGGEKILPGVAYLELARIAGEKSTHKKITQLKDVAWFNPIWINGAAKKVNISLYPSGEEIMYEVYSEQASEEQFHSKGKLSTQALAKPNAQNLASIQKRLLKSDGQERCYEKFCELGIFHGKSLQGIEELFYNEEEVLSKIYLPLAPDFVLDLGLMDSAVQSCIAGITFDKDNGLALPFSVREVNIYQDLNPSIWAYIRKGTNNRAKGKISSYDIDLLDESGEVLVQFKDFTALPLNSLSKDKASNTAPTNASTHLYQMAWQEAEVEATLAHKNTPEQLLLLIGGSTGLADKLEEALEAEVAIIPMESEEDCFINILNKIKEKLQQKSTTNITVVCRNSDLADYGFISGLLRTATQENPKITAKLVAVESLSIQKIEELTELLEIELEAVETEVRYTEGKRMVKVPTFLENDHLRKNKVEIKAGGVYLITGGVGGLGAIFAQRFAQTKDTHLILVGRSELTAKKKEWLTQIPNATYHRCDISSKEEVLELIKTIKQTHHRLDGILHAAGINRDNFIIKKTEAEARQVLAPKIAGAKNLDKATQNEALDFMVFFSSVAGIIGNIGQADYAAANVYLDYYAAYRNDLKMIGKRQGQTLSINWPLWKSGGMQVAKESEKYLEKRWGMLSLPTETGIKAFNDLLNSGADQGMVLFGEKEKIASRFLLKIVAEEAIVEEETTTVLVEETSTNATEIQQVLIELCATLLKISPTNLKINVDFAKYGVESIMMMKMLNALEEKFEIAIEPTAIVSYPTIELLAEYLLTEIPVTTIKKSIPKNGVSKSVKPISTTNFQKRDRRSRFNKRQATSSPTRTGKVAIIGMSCKLPESDNLNEFWDNLREARDLISDTPAERWDVSAFYTPEGGLDKTYTQKGGFVKNPGLFDADYFGLNDKDALAMDPQQRIVLELSRDLLAHAGYEKEELDGTKTGVYIGAKDNNYIRNNYHLLPQGAHQHTIVNYISNMIAARVSDFYNLKGTSHVIDTACSSSLVALHQACQDIIEGKTNLAIAGGISIMVDAFFHIGFSQAEVLSKEGKSYVFDKRAKGFVMGEGGGLVLLKDYDQAKADGDQIFGVIMGSSVNNDGKTMGLTVPNKEGQKAVIEETLKKAKVLPENISYYEAHGTGTLLGDPIEIKAATEIFRKSTDQKQYCAIGSVKSNLGHTMTAAGITGLLKILLQMQHGQIVPTLHCEEPHPRFKFEASPFYPNTKLQDWNQTQKIAAISSFGFGGTNAHMIISAPTEDVPVKRKTQTVQRTSNKYYWLGSDQEFDFDSIPSSTVSTTPAIAPEPLLVEDASESLQERILNFLKNKFAQALGKSPQEIATNLNFMDIGLDSTQLIDASQQMEKALDIELYPTLFFEYQNINELVDYFAEEYPEKFAPKKIKKEIPKPAENLVKENKIKPVNLRPATSQPLSFVKNKAATQKVNPNSEDIAIIGMSGYLPQSDDLNEFWNHISSSKDLITEIPSDRWDYKTWFDQDRDADNKTYSKWGGFLKEVDKFDPLFFGIAPRQATWMDPQLRLMLQSAYHTFEDAGVVNEIKGSRTGVFVGSCFSEYWDEIVREQRPLTDYQHNSSGMSSLAAGVSYYFDLQGASVPLDNACASSLTALHLGCQAIRSGEIDTAVIGGMNVLLSPLHYVYFSRIQALSPTGRCHTFDQKADGYVPGEGIVSVLIKPLSKAIADGNKIHGVIKGSAINHVGKSNNPTSPRPELQTKLLFDAWEAAGINPEDISYIETHGTGTTLGDPIEINALKNAFKKYTNKEDFCTLGSTKAHIGHLEGAAGLASVIKVLLMMKNNTIPRMPNFESLNPYIKLSDSPFKINVNNEKWHSDQALLAGVSSFGMTGNNAHVVLESFSNIQPSIYTNDAPAIVTLSAKTEERLMQQVSNVMEYCEKNAEFNLAELAYTLQMDRMPMEARFAMVVKDKKELFDSLQKYLKGNKQELLTRNIKTLERKTDVKAMETVIQEALTTQNYNALAKLWIDGFDLNWSVLYPEKQPNKINLPLYPFAAERYWKPAVEQIALPTDNGKIHPLLHRNTSNFKQQQFTSIYSGKESFLAEHKVLEDKVLPGVAYLELARIAGEESLQKKITHIKDVTWLQPISVNGMAKEIQINLSSVAEEIEYVVASSEDGKDQIHSQGIISEQQHTQPKSHNVLAIKEYLNNTKKGEECYEVFRSLGINHGTCFQGIEDLFFNEKEALAKISLAQEKDFVLSPGVLDSALQTCLGIDFEKRSQNLELPFSVKDVILFAPLTETAWCYARKSMNSEADDKVSSYEIDLLNEAGEVLLRFKDFVFLTMNTNKDTNAIEVEKLTQNGEGVFYAPKWMRQRIKSTEYAQAKGKHLIVTGGCQQGSLENLKNVFLEQGVNFIELIELTTAIELPSDITDIYFHQGLCMPEKEDSLYEGYEAREFSVFNAIKALLLSEYNESELNITVFTRNTQKVLQTDRTAAKGAGIVGLIGSFAKEKPNWNIRAIDLSEAGLQQKDLEKVLNIPFEGEGDIVAYRNGYLYERSLYPIELSGIQNNKIRKNGTYVMLGGAGGIGKVTTRHLVKKYQAQVIWLGRRALDENIRQAQREIEKIGRKPIYIQCDATDKKSMEQAYVQIKRSCQEIHGLFHSAIVLNDMLLKNMSEADFKKSFEPKSLASHHLIETFQTEPLDFICFYSSVQSQLNAPGQANYSAGCTYKDSYAQSLKHKLKVPTHIINWGYWGDVGVVSSEDYKKKMELAGISGISSKEGMAILETVLASEQNQVAAIKFI